MKNKYRLTSTVYDREQESDKIKPLKIYFISVEGNATEKEYFEGISKNRLQLGINAKVNPFQIRSSQTSYRFYVDKIYFASLTQYYTTFF